MLLNFLVGAMIVIVDRECLPNKKGLWPIMATVQRKGSLKEEFVSCLSCERRPLGLIGYGLEFKS